MRKLLYRYLKFWASGYLKRTKPEIVAITGSVGKTSTKEAIFEVLKAHFNENVRKAYGNLNNEAGVPAAILDFKAAPSYEANNPLGWIPIILLAPFKSFFLRPVKILVLELAADKPGDIKYLTSFARPKIAVITAIGPAHLSAFGSIDKIIEEKTDLLRALPYDGWAILNLDDENTKKISYGGRWQKITYAITNDADIKAGAIKTKIENYQAETKFKIIWDKKEIDVNQKTLGGKANVLASLAAVAVGNIYKLKKAEIIEGLSKIKSEKHRLNVFCGKNKTIIIDDSYNANPLSMAASLELLSKIPVRRPSKKIAVLGDMLEISDGKKAHQLIGNYARKVADMVIAVGKKEAKRYQGQKYFSEFHKASQYILDESRCYKRFGG